MAITGKWHGCHFKNTPPEVSSCRNGCNKNYLVIPFAVLLYLNIFGILLHFLMFNFEKSLSYFLVSNSLNTVSLRTKYFLFVWNNTLTSLHKFQGRNQELQILRVFWKKIKKIWSTKRSIVFFRKNIWISLKKKFHRCRCQKIFPIERFSFSFKIIWERTVDH